MAMHSFQQELDPATHEMTPPEHPVLRGLMADRDAAHAEEVRLLRQRVAVLESALAAATASQFDAEPKPASAVVTKQRHLTPVSEFTAPVTPAVVAMDETPTPTTSETEAAPAAGPDQGFAAAWSQDSAGDSSFEERIAEKAFFQVGVVDETSRNWLLTS